MNKILESINIKKSFGSVEVLKGISLDVFQGDVIAILGSSGSGKSTFLRILNMLEIPDAGSVSIDGEHLLHEIAGKITYPSDFHLKRIRLKMGMVFQQFNLFPHINVLQNIMRAPILVKNQDKAVAEKKARHLLEKVGLQDKANSYPCQLSGGQQQRIAIARALAMEPEILCFDEPTSALDPELTGEVLKVMRDLAKEGTTMLVVTHEIGFARDVASKVIFMDDGVILDQGTPEQILNNPSNDRIRQFLGQ